MTPATQTPTPPAFTVNGGSTTTTLRPKETAQPARSEKPFVRYLWAATRLCLGWTFLWPFLDKTFGLGHETARADAWISGGNPTEGFLSHSAGPFSSIYQSIAGAGVVNVLFMVGLLAIGVALLLGIAMRRPASPARRCSCSCGPRRSRPRTTCSWTTTSSTRSS